MNSHGRTSEVLADTLEKPLLDTRTYRVIRLPNQLEALIIHDADTDKASAAMDVNVGSFSDSDDLPGMAHAVEHLLFMGTEKYPVENEYNSYLTKFGGSSNAFTAATSTNYYFELSASASSNSPSQSASSSTISLAPTLKGPLYGALDRFSQFFVRPLFLADTLDRELRAVDSENKKNLQSDTWRLYQLEKSLSNKQHPLQKFSTGNYKTLHDDPIERGVKIRDAFIDFWDRHYSANRMKLVVLGRESLDELQSWVEEFFSGVINKNLPQLRWDDVPALGPEQLGTQVFAKPVMDQKMLDIIFPYPDQEDLWESSPSRYVSHLIGHEGPGSILAYLKTKGWANELSAGASPICPGTSLFQINIRLAEAGLKNYHEIVKVVFQYIALLKQRDPQEWIVDEMARLADVEFKYRQKIPASRTTSQIAGVMQRPFPRNQLISAQSLIRRFDPKAISEGLAALRPDNFRIVLVSQEYPGDWPLKEKWYGTEYKVERLPQKVLQELQETVEAGANTVIPELHLPAKNEFVPSRLDVEKKETDTPLITPKLIRNDENVRTWFKKDDRFWVPKANVDVALRSPLVNASPLTMAMTMLYKELVQDSLSEYAYDADLAGLQYSVAAHSQGLDVSLSGYNDKMSVLLEKVLSTMRDLNITDDRFEVVKERTLRSYRNFEFQDPFRFVTSFSRWLISEQGWATHELLQELPAVTADELRKFFPQVLNQMHIELLVHGNLYKRDALHMSEMVEKILKPHRLPTSQWPARRNIVIAPGQSFVYPRTIANVDNINHCIEYTLVIGQNVDYSTRAKLLLLAQMLDEPCFDQLRTKEQLGYVVGSGPLMLNVTSAFRVVIQSERDCKYLEERIDSFLTGFEKSLQDMSEEDFTAHKTGIINKRLEKFKNLDSESRRFWHHITSEAYDFELVTYDVEHLEALTKQDILSFYKQYFHPASSTRAKASVHLIAQASAEDIAAKISPEEQMDKLSEVIGQILSQIGIELDRQTLTERLSKIDVIGGDVEGIAAMISEFLKKSAQVPEEQAGAFVQEGKAALAKFLPSLGIQPKPSPDAAVPLTNGHSKEHGNEQLTNGHAKEDDRAAIVIDNVKAWKATMPVSAGAKPVKALSEFEEPEAKL